MADIDSRDGKTYATQPILDWLGNTHAPHDPALEFAFTAPRRTSLAAIQVGPSEGKLLSVLVRLSGARKVVEVGMLAGYSSLWIARALPAGGTLFSIDHDPEACATARDTFQLGGVEGNVKIIHADGPAGLHSIEASGPFDMVFLDADKARYDVYARWATKNLRPGGILVGDNAFLFGKLLHEDDAAARSMREFHQELARHYDSTCIPTPDGMAVGILRGSPS